MSCVTYFGSVESEICNVMTAGVPEDDEIFRLNSSHALPTYEDARKQFILLSNRDKTTREIALVSLREQISSLVEYFSEKNGINSASQQDGLQRTNGYKESCAATPNNTKIGEVDLSSFGTPDQVLNHLLGSFLRLSMWCPYEDVRVGCKETLVYLEEQGFKIPKALAEEPSAFIPHSYIPPVDTDDEEIYSLYVESYAQTCRLEHMVLVMGMHPQYLKEFLSVNMALLENDGALPRSHRSYIGILAAARHKCQYLVHLMETDFLMTGGDPQWLCGIEHASPKIRSLSTLNKLLAHRPWLVNSRLIEELCIGGDGWQWSQSELIQAIVLMCHFHSLAVFCHGAGINLEVDHTQTTDLKNRAIYCPHVNGMKRNSCSDSCSNESSENGSVPENDIDALMQKMLKLEEEHEDDMITREELNRRFERQKIEALTQILPGSQEAEIVSDKSYCNKYIDDADFSYQDFAKRSGSEEIPTFRAMDFNWQDHAYSLVSRYYQQVADMLDTKFETAYNMTYNTLATKEHVDTSKLRRAIWMYIHCTCGIMFDDYNYGEVNELLERSLKLFIKTASCYPELTTKQIYDGFWKRFRHSEKVHVNIVLLEGRFQVELLYALRAVTEYIK